MVPQLAQALVQKFINQPTYMQGVTDVLTMLKDNRKLARNTDYSPTKPNRITDVYQKMHRRTCGNTSFVDHGHFSVCFKHTDKDGDEYAIKVSLREDDGAPPFYKWVWENKKWEDNEHYPVLYFFGKVCGYDVCVMEWLSDGSQLSGLGYWAAVGGRSEVEDRPSEHEHHTMRLLEAGEELALLSETMGLSFDLHSENVRCRDDGTLVYSDPFGFIRKEHWS